MLKSRVLARRYADAFFRAIGGAQARQPFEEFMTFVRILEGEPAFREFFLHPVIPLAAKMAAARQALAGASSPRLADFVCVLLRRFRFDHLDAIARELQDLFRKANSIVLVRVTSAVPLTEAERQALIVRLERRIAGTVTLEEHVEPHLRGGLVIWFNDQIFDASVTTRLGRLRERLSSLTAHLIETIQEAPSQLS